MRLIKQSGSLGAACQVPALALVLVALAAHSASADEPRIPELKAKAEKGFVAQEIELAAAYFTGHGVAQDLKQAAHWYEKAAKGGNPEAQTEIGYLYQAGTGVPADAKRAYHWYLLAAASGFPDAKVNLGVCYVWGLGVPRDDAFASQLFREAAAKGNGAGANYLGNMYYTGRGMKMDRAEGERWYEKGAKLHDPVAAFNLGLLFSTIQDHPHDFPKAAGLLRDSAEAGYVPAMHSLGQLLMNHPQLAKSVGEARSHLETASTSGAWKASILLGIVERDGNGTPRDPEAAYFHFQIAIHQGGEEAKRLLFNDLRGISARLTVERRLALESQANAWYDQHHLTLAFVYKNDGNWRQFPALARTMPAEGVYAGQMVPSPPA